MKPEALLHILLVSNRYFPDYGGIETVSIALARGFTDSGHTVTVATHSEGPEYLAPGYHILRNPGPLALLKATAEADVVLHNNICLRFLWPMIFIRRPLAIAVHNWLQRSDGLVGYREKVKRWVVSRSSIVIAASEAIGRHIPIGSVTVANAYDEKVFNAGESEGKAPNSIAFVGRLVSEKGVSVLLDAIAHVKASGIEPRLTIIGDGPAMPELVAQVANLGLRDNVIFAGALEPPAVADRLKDHHLMVVPSVYEEPFGIVALEGIASGCYVIATNSGGLPEAVGPCGELFVLGDDRELASRIVGALSNRPWASELYCSDRATHLARFETKNMVEGYLRALTSCYPGSRHRVSKPSTD